MKLNGLTNWTLAILKKRSRVSSAMGFGMP